jgi:hypothetical protein
VKKRHIIAEIIICVAAVLSFPTLIAPFIFVPIAFAYPVIVDERKLLYIPLGIIGAILLIIFFLEVTAVIFFLFVFGVIGGIGIGAGLLIRRFREARRWVKILATATSIVILLVPGVFVLDLFSGVVRRPFANWDINSYIARTYSAFDLTVGRLSFDFKSNEFRTLVQDSNNPDLSFQIRLRDGAIHDGFTGGIFWTVPLNQMLTPLLREEFGNEFGGIRTTVRGVQAGQAFDKTADVEKSANITILTDCPAPKTLAAQITRYHEFLLQSGFHFRRYTFQFQYENAPPIRGAERVIDVSVSPALINTDLPALIYHARLHRRDNGVYFDNSIGFRYVSRVGMEEIS